MWECIELQMWMTIGRKNNWVRNKSTSNVTSLFKWSCITKKNAGYNWRDRKRASWIGEQTIVEDKKYSLIKLNPEFQRCTNTSLCECTQISMRESPTQKRDSTTATATHPLLHLRQQPH